MNFEFTEEQLMIQELARRFAEEELRPIADELDKKAKFPTEAVRKMGELSLLGICVPEEYGGAGMDMLSYVLAVEQVARVCASSAVTMGINNSLVLHLMMAHCSEEQKRKYVPSLARGEMLGCYALTEPNAGSDAANQKTSAVRKGDRYSLNGRKAFISNGIEAGLAIVYASTDRSKGPKGISAFLVETKTPGFIVEKKEKKLGIRGSSCVSLVFENCEVPSENLIGQEGEGLKIALATLEAGRIGISAQALGIATASLEEAVKYAKQREQFGQPIANFQAIQWMIADVRTSLEAARLLTYRAAILKEQGKRTPVESSMAKLFSSETCMKAAWTAVQIHGGYGYVEDYVVERLFRDAKITEIYEGTSEVQRMVIAKNVLKGR